MANKNRYADHIKEIDAVLIKLQSRISMLDKRRNTVARMKRVVNRQHWGGSYGTYWHCKTRRSLWYSWFN